LLTPSDTVDEIRLSLPVCSLETSVHGNGETAKLHLILRGLYFRIFGQSSDKNDFVHSISPLS